MPEEERRISPAVAIIPVGLGLAAVVGLAAMAWAAPPVFTCPHCGATFATQEELNYHIQTEHPEVPPVAEFEVSDLVISPYEVQIGYPVSISCLVQNIGTETGSKTIICEVEGTIMEKTVTLGPGESQVVSFEVTPEVAKAYSVSLDGLYGTFVATEIGVPAYSVALEVSNMNPEVGEKISCWIDITNIGTAPGTPIVSFYIDGALAASRTLLPISPGETGQTYVGFSLDTPGTHILRAETDTAFAEIAIIVEEIAVADIKVENLVITPTDPMVGEIVTISVTATNIGTATGSKTIVCTVT